MDASVTLKGAGEVGCFCSNNYLGLANHPAVVEALSGYAERYGVGSGASRLISGHMEVHAELEDVLHEFLASGPSLLRCLLETGGQWGQQCLPAGGAASASAH